MIADFQTYLDADERTRTTIRRRLDLNLFVEAGAGTGKTRALVDRYVALIDAGHRVEELVAITFTEKAAAELRERVRAEIERLVLAGQGNLERLRVARDSLERAQISTIHAFCANVLRTFAAENGIDPSFAVQDQVAATRRFEQQWLAYLESLSNNHDAHAVFQRVQEMGLWPRDLEKLASELWENPALAQRLDEQPLTAAAAVWPDVSELQRQLAELGAERVVAGDLLRKDILGLQRVVDELVPVLPEQGHVHLQSILPGLTVGNRGRSANWTIPGGIEEARATAKEVLLRLQNALADMRSEALGAFLPLVVRFAVDDARSRARNGELVFEDLIFQVRNILQSSPEARRRLRRRYHAMLVDEFQDTDPAQTEIALSFAEDPDSGLVEPGRLFLVGDPKQSIYRFRRADMTVYSKTRTMLREAGGSEEQLALNRRSRAEVIDFVNGVFEGLVGEGTEPWLQPAYHPVHPQRSVRLEGPGVALVGGVSSDDARNMRAKEAQQLAAYCRALRDQRWQVVERTNDTETVREALYKDVAILVPSRAILAPLEGALNEAGIPYRVEGGSLVYATQEVRDLINCITAIDDPTDEVAIVGALRSPAYAISDVELAEHRLGGGYFDYMGRLDSGVGRVNEALRHLRGFHDQRARLSIAELIERYIASKRVVEAGMYVSGSRDAFRRARFVIEQARIFEADRPESLRAFSDWLERRADEAIYDYEGAALDDDEDAVRIMTVHAAKGLEFPIVFLAGLGTSPSNQFGNYLIDRNTDEVAVQVGSATRGNKATLGPRSDVEAEERRHQDAERVRLLYVGATRARDHLVVSLFHQAKARDTYSQTLQNAGVGFHAMLLPELPAVTGAATGPFEGLDVDAHPGSEEEFAARRAELVADARGQLVSSATALGRMKDGEADEEKEREDETEPWSRGRAGTHRGRAVHAALQVLPWDADDATIDALARAQAVVETVPDEAETIASLLRRALATGAAARARAAKRAMREVPFAFVADGVVLEGFIDLVLEGQGGSLEVIDWKTDSVADSEVEERLASYRLQAGLYVLGIEAATARRVERVTYVFVTPGREVSPGEPGPLAEDARDRIRAHAEMAG